MRRRRSGSTSPPTSMPGACPSTRRGRAPADRMPGRPATAAAVGVIVAGLPSLPPVAGVAVAGIAGGLVLLGRGLVGYRAAGRIAGTSPSRIASIAVGEVLVSGSAEPIELTL